MPRRAGLALTLGVALLIGPQSSARPAPPAAFLGSFTLTSDAEVFGGLSAIEVNANGAAFLALGDKGTLFEGTLTRDETGLLTGAQVNRITPLTNSDGQPLPAAKSDSEGMDLAADGSLLISFEGRPSRIALYRDGPPQELPSAKAFKSFARNEGLEAVARDASGTVYAIPEGSKGDEFPVFRLRNDHWDRKLTLPRRGSFLPVSADIGPDGRLYLLERKFISPFGFSSRLRRFDLGEDSLSGETILLETALGVHDNLEGLSIWRDATCLRATMVTDDNFMWFLTTALVEYRLPD